MQIFATTHKLIISVEFHLASVVPSGIGAICYIQRLIVLPAKFLKMGVAEKLKGASVWSFLAFVCIMCGAWVVNHAGLAGTEVATYVLLLSEILPLFLVVFAVPSMYGDSGVQPTSVAFVAKRLGELGLQTSSQVALLRSSVLQFEARVKVRVTAMKWLVGLLWAALVYAVTKSDIHTLQTPASAKSFIVMTALLLVSTAIAYVLVWGYEASANKLFRVIGFGCDEFCSSISG